MEVIDPMYKRDPTVDAPRLSSSGSGAAGGSVRNPRRRQRNDSESARNQPRRKRSKLTDETFTAHDGEVEVNGDGETAHMNGHTTQPRLSHDLVVRSGKKVTLKRQPRGDGAQVLTANANYTVKSLPSTPRELRRGSVEFRGSICQASGLALAVTRKEALIWEYGSHSAVTNPRVFGMPFSVPEGEALPFGRLVTGGGTKDTGLVLLDANTGKIVFIESIERAANLGLFEAQERQRGVEGAIPGFFSGETVDDFVDAETAGFIATLSSGRLAQITLRDVQGKARVQAQILRETASERSGWAATFKGFLGAGAWKVDVAAVHTRSLGARGQMQVLAATENGVCKAWDLDWSGRADHRGNIDIKEMLMHELKATMPPESQGFAEPVALMDFAFVGNPVPSKSTSNNAEDATPVTEKPVDLLVLARTGPEDMQHFFLVEVTLSGTVPEIKQVISLKARETSRTSASPKLIFPDPGHTAYVVFKDSVVVAAIPSDSSDPEAQLHDESYIEPESFEDVLYLRRENGMAFLDAQAEETKSSQASCFAFVQGAGLVRFSATDVTKRPDLSRVSVKSKLEQAVFYGVLQENNILDLARHSVRFGNLDEIEDAAIELSSDILRSEGDFISRDPTSIDAHLTRRAQALHALIVHLRQSYPSLSKRTMWRLLWDAEKIAAGQRLWKTWETYLAVASQGRKRKSTLLHQICDLLQSLHPYDLPANAGQDDQVRTMFVTRLEYIDKLLPWARSIMSDVKESGKSHDEILRLLAEANDIWQGTLDAAFNFRTENAQLYDLPPDGIPEGVLLDPAAYQGLPEFWTSSDAIVNQVIKMLAVIRDVTVEAYEADISEASGEIVKRIASGAPHMVELMCLAFQERIHWVRSAGSQKYTDKADKLRVAYLDIRDGEIRSLSALGQVGKAMDLAEKYRAFDTLTAVLVAEAQYLEENEPFTHGAARTAIKYQTEEINKRSTKYFSRYGDDWANAFFDVGFSGSGAARMLKDGQERWPKALTKYLRADPKRAKICWINDVTAEKDFKQATKALKDAAHKQDERQWYKKVELSMAKLSMLAAAESSSSAGTKQASQFMDSELKLIDMQDRVYRHVLPEILHALDEPAELQLAMERFARGCKDYPAFLRLLEIGMSKLLTLRSLTLEELIDLLTLMDTVQSTNPDTDLAGEDFLLALNALAFVAPELPSQRLETLLQLIWKRAFVATDWAALDKSASKRSGNDTQALLVDTALFRTLLAGKKAGLFPTSPGMLDNLNAPVRPLSPQDCVGAGSEPADLAHRFSADMAEAVAHDNRVQGQKLAEYINSARLGHWVQDVERLAQQAWEEDVEEEAAEAAAQREIDDSVVEIGEVRVNGHGNGYMNGDGDPGIKMEEIEGNGVVYGREEDEMQE